MLAMRGGNEYTSVRCKKYLKNGRMEHWDNCYLEENELQDLESRKRKKKDLRYII